jgi:hypothetical protein
MSGETTAPVPRCEICDWPLAESMREGCVEGNCSYRTDDPAERRKLSQRREFVHELSRFRSLPRHEQAEEVLARIEQRGETFEAFWRRLSNFEGDHER